MERILELARFCNTLLIVSFFFASQGFAYVGGACVVNKRLEKVNSVAIIEDTGGFSGIIVAAHEVGHL
jgi:Metallo-peptidase family M12B Reprolysin-like